ncbi:MAG: 1,4-dihydroxy-2-naphthoate polyprenyltransferase [Rhodothermales bacterium]|nr:1,4-dihydroxy-2-naphthoate polyprenyltransferase [Rhodothermales bacterium]
MEAFRPKTLPAAAAPVVVGTALALGDGVVHWVSAFLALMSALLIQVGTNLFNDYADFQKGADTDSRIGPLRVTQAGLIKPRSVLIGAIIAFILSAVSGAYLMYRGGLPIVIIGVVSICCGFLYTGTRYSLSYTGLADLFVLIFFGPVAVAGTYYVQALSVSSLEIIAGLSPGLLATAILLVNNIRDVEEDRLANKNTLIVRSSIKTGYAAYLIAIIVAGAIPVVLSVMGLGPPWGLLAGIVVVPGAFLFARLRSAETGDAYNKVLAATAKLLLLYAVLFAVGWNI